MDLVFPHTCTGYGVNFGLRMFALFLCLYVCSVCLSVFLSVSFSLCTTQKRTKLIGVQVLCCFFFFFPVSYWVEAVWMILTFPLHREFHFHSIQWKLSGAGLPLKQAILRATIAGLCRGPFCVSLSCYGERPFSHPLYCLLARFACHSHVT